MAKKFKFILFSFIFTLCLLFPNPRKIVAVSPTQKKCEESPLCLLNTEWKNHLDLKHKFNTYLKSHPIQIKKSKPKKIKHRYVLFAKNLREFVFSSLTFVNGNLEVEPYTYYYVKDPWTSDYEKTAKMFSVYYNYDEDFIWKNNYTNREIEIKFRYFLIEEGFKPISKIDYGTLTNLKLSIDWMSNAVNLEFSYNTKEHNILIKKIKEKIGTFEGVREEEAEECSNNIGIIRSYSEQSGNLILANIPYAYLYGVYGIGCHLQPRAIQVLFNNGKPEVNFFNLPYDLADPP